MARVFVTTIITLGNSYVEALRLRGLTGDEAYHILEIVEAREHRSTIFGTQFDNKG